MDAKLNADMRYAVFNLLARREHSRKELYDKLKRRFDDRETVDQVLDEIKQEGLQSDERFAESFVRSRVQRGQGPVKIRYDLRQKGIPGDLIDASLEAFDDRWMSLAKDLVNGKYGGESATDQKEKQRRMRFVMQRGFPSEICYKLFD